MTSLFVRGPERGLVEDPFLIVRHLADRGLAPLQPLFVAMGLSWTSAVPPAQALRAALWLTLFGTGDDGNSASALCANLALNASLREFIGAQSGEAIDPAALTAAHERLLKNVLARRFVSDVVAAASSRGLIDDGRCRLDQSFNAAWAA